MSALWGRVRDGLIRAYRATCDDCDWAGPMHFEVDSDAVKCAAEDSAGHNRGMHGVETERAA